MCDMKAKLGGWFWTGQRVDHKVGQFEADRFDGFCLT